MMNLKIHIYNMLPIMCKVILVTLVPRLVQVYVLKLFYGLFWIWSMKWQRISSCRICVKNNLQIYNTFLEDIHIENGYEDGDVKNEIDYIVINRLFGTLDMGIE